MIEYLGVVTGGRSLMSKNVHVNVQKERELGKTEGKRNHQVWGSPSSTATLGKVGEKPFW